MARRRRAPLGNYSRAQRRVIRALDREFDSRHYHGRRARVIGASAYMTGIVESSLRNLGYGDASSVNWRQETAGSYPNVDRMNLRGSVGRYFDEAEAAYRKGIKPGVLSQAVQRSAFPGRYAEHRSEALSLLKAGRGISWKGDKASYSGGGGGGGLSATAPSVSREQVEPQVGVSALLRALSEQSKPAPVSGTPLQAPSFSAAPVMPGGFSVPESGPPAPPEPDVSELMKLVQPGAGLPQSTLTPGSVSGGVAGRAGRGGRGGRVGRIPRYGPHGGRDVTPNGHPIDRAGAPTRPAVLHAVDYIGDILGSSIGYGTGTAHDKFTVSGNVSDHYSGMAVDLPSTGKRLYAIGRSALIAAGMNPHTARHASGGLYNINGWQIIFATSGPGVGDHWDHVHVHPPSGWHRPRRRRPR